ncbi:MAG: hypothetical protein NZ455_03930 [Bacteroidia bacterium]|nr:hypothetical protein [Bacteroidia bacterium]
MRHAEGALAVRSTEAIAQPAARRPEAQRRDTPKKFKITYPLKLIQIFTGVVYHS